MKKKALLNIVSTQYIDETCDEIKIETYADFYKKSNNFYISYEDSGATGFENHKTFLNIEENKVTVKRIGKYSSTLIMDEKLKTISKYPVEFGHMILGISDVDINNTLDNNGGLLNISYNMDIENKHICKTNLNINIKVL